jgi:glycosyltransferase involved in cell wall biosynthesis
VQRVRRVLAGWLPRFVLRRADLVLPIRNHMVPAIRRAGARETAVCVVPHGIDLAAFTSPCPADARQTFGLPEGVPVVSFVGRMSADNYIRDLAEAIGQIAARRRNAVFVLVGDGEEAEAAKSLLSPYLGSSVRMFPFQPWERVVALRRISAVSICLMGGFSLIEACAAGSPVVAYDVEWHRELVEDGVTGCLVPEHQVGGVVAAIERLLDDEAGARQMGQRARERAFDRHDIRQTRRIKQHCYAQLFARGEVSPT